MKTLKYKKITGIHNLLISSSNWQENLASNIYMMLSTSLHNKNRKTTAWIFPGQGSQKQGMALDLLKFTLTKLRLQQAENILGWSISQLLQSQHEKLSFTVYAQPCLYVVMALLVDLMKRSGYQPNVVTGYSFGEYVALYAAGAYDFETGLQLIQKRAEIMSRLPKGSMVTLTGFDREKLQQEVTKTPNVWFANDDLKYTIIAGTSEGITSVLSNVEIERVIPLNVSSAFHTPLVEPAAREFQEVLDSIPFQSFRIPVFSSTDFVLSHNIQQIKRSLIQQIAQPVRWQMISRSLVTQGIEQAIQFGCGQALLKPMKQNSPNLEISNIESNADIERMVICDRFTKLSTIKPKVAAV